MSCALSGVGERLHHRGHAGVALAVLEQRQLLGDVALGHAGQARVLRIGRVAVEAVAGGAGAGLGRAGLGVAPVRLGRSGRGIQRRGLHRRVRQRGDGGLGERGGTDGEAARAAKAAIPKARAWRMQGSDGTGRAPTAAAEMRNYRRRRGDGQTEPQPRPGARARVRSLRHGHPQSAGPRQVPAVRAQLPPAAARRRLRGRLRRPLQRRQVQRAQRDVPAERAGPRLQDARAGRSSWCSSTSRPPPTATWSTCPATATPRCPQDLQAHWQAFLDGYFGRRDALHGLVVVMDIRHPLKDYDRQMLGYAVKRGLPAHALLTKADKLGRGAAGQHGAGGAHGTVVRVRRHASACRPSRASRSRASTRRARSWRWLAPTL